MLRTYLFLLVLTLATGVRAQTDDEPGGAAETITTRGAGLSIDYPADPLLQNAFNRPATSLNGQWNYLVDRYETSFYNFFRVPFDSLPPSQYGRDAVFLDETPRNKTDRLEYDWDTAARMQVPGDWNSQDEQLWFYEGSVWYRRKFDDPRENANDRLLLYFGGANYRTDVYLNGRKVGEHTGGFTPFNFFIEDDNLRATGNSLVVRVDNARDRSGVPTDVTDWWNYGGLTRDVKLIALPETYIGDYLIQLDPERPRHLVGHVELRGPNDGNRTVRLRCATLGVDVQLTTDAAGRAEFDLDLGTRNLRRWTPEDPYRYAFTLTSGNDQTIDRIGLRTITADGPRLLLNGEEIFLRGISCHEENPLKGGRATGYDDARLLIGWAQELNCNFMRLAHYPHNEYMPRLAEEMGMLLWEEIPVYWTIDWDNERTYALAEQQLDEMLQRDKNRASVIVWSMANETPPIQEKQDFLKGLADYTRDFDPTRLISAALFKSTAADGSLTVDDPFSRNTDIIAFNQYLGWYEGEPDYIATKNFVFQEQKPVIVSEWGAGATPGYHADSLTRWTEEYQDWLYREQLELMDRIPQLVGFTPWILADFHSPRRMHPIYQQTWNRKGVIGSDGTRKLAFDRLQEYYRRKREESSR